MTGPRPQVRIYTDGGCRPNPGPGGWAAILLRRGEDPQELSGGEPETTNNRMELRAAIEGLSALEEPHRVELHTDSTYLRNGITEWLPRWRAGGWRTRQKGEVKNQDLWRELDRLSGMHEVTWQWVKGHAGDRWNERADRLAAAAIPAPELPLDDEDAVHLFAAVVYSGKSGAGGWGVLLSYRDRQRSLSGRAEGTSANRMHLQAVAAGLGELKRASSVHVYTTSDYAKDGATAWIGSWRGRGWRTRDGKPVSHRDLWQRIDRLQQRHRVEWHVVDRDQRPEPMVEAKRLAREAARDEET